MTTKSYFSHDSDARSDEKIIALRMKHHWEGYGLYWALIERLRECKDYALKADYNILAFDLRTDAELVKSIVCDFELFTFTPDGVYFYSESLRTRMASADEKRAKLSDAGKRGSAKRTATLKPPLSHPIATLKQEEKRREEKSKEKESKKETSPEGEDKKAAAPQAATLHRKEKFYTTLVPFTAKYPPEMIRAFFDYWSEMNKSATKMRFELEKTWELPRRLSTWAGRERIKPSPDATTDTILTDNTTTKYDNHSTLWDR